MRYKLSGCTLRIYIVTLYVVHTHTHTHYSGGVLIKLIRRGGAPVSGAGERERERERGGGEKGEMYCYIFIFTGMQALNKKRLQLRLDTEEILLFLCTDNEQIVQWSVVHCSYCGMHKWNFITLLQFCLS